MLGRRALTLILMVGAIALFGAGVAAASGGWQPGSEPAPPESVVSPDTASTEIPTTDSTAAVAADDGDDADSSEVTEVKKEHPVNFGGTISSMRHEGDHTPAAIVKDPTKKVPGYTKKTTTTTLTVEPPAPEVVPPEVVPPDVSPDTSIETPPTS